jgi:hypothetical protein
MRICYIPTRTYKNNFPTNGQVIVQRCYVGTKAEIDQVKLMENIKNFLEFDWSKR